MNAEVFDKSREAVNAALEAMAALIDEGWTKEHAIRWVMSWIGAALEHSDGD